MQSVWHCAMYISIISMHTYPCVSHVVNLCAHQYASVNVNAWANNYVNVNPCDACWCQLVWEYVQKLLCQWVISCRHVSVLVCVPACGKPVYAHVHMQLHVCRSTWSEGKKKQPKSGKNVIVSSLQKKKITSSINDTSLIRTNLLT